MPVLVLSESQLQQVYLSCGMYEPIESDPVEGAARLTFRWALRKRQGGVVPEPEQLRASFMTHWREIWGDRAQSGSYWKGPTQAAGVARRIYEFLLKHEVFRPYEPYTLDLGEFAVTGESAIVLWRKSRLSVPVKMVVGMHYRRPRDVRVPHHPILAQWLAARQEIEDVDLGIIHVPLLWGDRWTNSDIDEALARRWLRGIVRTSKDHVAVPRSGAQCASCKHPCTSVFRGPEAAGPALWS